MVRLINQEDHKVADAVGREAQHIARAVDIITGHMKQGGRLIYVGAGTSGRLGILDAVECPPTYSTEPELVQGLIAGGTPAIFRAVEGAEDDPDLGRKDLEEIQDVYKRQSPHWTAVCVCVVTMRPMTSLQERIGRRRM